MSAHELPIARLDSTESARDSGQESVSLFLPLDTNKIGVKTTGTVRVQSHEPLHPLWKEYVLG